MTGNAWDVSVMSAMAAEMHIALRQYEAALKELNGALSISDQTTMKWIDAESMRLRGEAKLLSSSGQGLQTACSELEAARELAHQRGSKMFELRSSISLAKSTDAPVKRTTTMARISALLSEIDADETEWDIQQARVFIAGNADNY